MDRELNVTINTEIFNSGRDIQKFLIFLDNETFSLSLEVKYRI
jgi:hypothetical protein